MKKVLSVVLAIVIACSVCVVTASAVGSEYGETFYSVEEIESNANLYAIGATKAEYVVAKFSEDNTKVVITKNGNDSDGIISSNYGFVFSLLEEIVIGDGVRDYNSLIFQGSETFKTIRVSSDNEYYATVDGVLFSKDMKELVQFPVGKELTSYSVPESVTTIGDYAFAYSSLKEINFSSSLEAIDDGAFEHCNSLVEVVLPEGLISIGFAAFEYCSSLERLVVPSTLTQVDAWVFDECTALSDIEIADGCTAITGSLISDSAFYNDEKNWDNDVLYSDGYLFTAKDTILGEYNVREGTRTIADNAFAHCYNLTSVEIPVGVTAIGDNAFYCCVSLEEVVIPEGVTFINSHTFQYCESLMAVTIPKSVNDIGEATFEDCENVIIYGYEGSYAEEYANENQIPFVVISDNPIIDEVGDVNGDGKVSALDARWVLQYVVGAKELNESQVKSADANNDGKVSSIDARRILQIVADVKSV